MRDRRRAGAHRRAQLGLVAGDLAALATSLRDRQLAAPVPVLDGNPEPPRCGCGATCSSPNDLAWLAVHGPHLADDARCRAVEAALAHGG